jgi:hypothetical protein
VEGAVVAAMTSMLHHICEEAVLNKKGKDDSRHKESQERLEVNVRGDNFFQTPSHLNDAACTLKMRPPISIRRLLHLVETDQFS